MAEGILQIDRVTHDSLTPEAKLELDTFLLRAEQDYAITTEKGHYLYHLNHPDFLPLDPPARYDLVYGYKVDKYTHRRVPVIKKLQVQDQGTKEWHLCKSYYP